MNYSIKKLVVGLLETNCYFLCCNKTNAAFVIDPGDNYPQIFNVINKEKFNLKGIINTHGHADHIGANDQLKKKYNVPIFIHQNDSQYLLEPNLNGSQFLNKVVTSPPADVLLTDLLTLDLGKLQIKIIHTPGHTPGSICIQTENVLFSGDTLFLCSIGRTDFLGGDQVSMMNSLNKLKKLDPKIIVLPGHGKQTSIGYESKNNPFLWKT